MRTLFAIVTVLVCLAVVVVPAFASPDDSSQQVVSGYGRALQFAGYTWRGKISNVLVGPGPNYFSDAPNNVWTDDGGNLHLRAAQDDAGRWQAAEVVLQPSLGYGTYCFELKGLDRPLDPNLVLGLFTWNDRPEDNHRELDIEISRWGRLNGTDGRYSVQPFELPDHTYSFTDGDESRPATQCLAWTENEVVFNSWQGFEGTPSTGSTIASHSFSDGIPHALDEQIRINLWLLDGQAPTDGQAAEVVITGFNFTPTPSSLVMGTNA